jgi:hypothetical protein
MHWKTALVVFGAWMVVVAAIQIGIFWRTRPLARVVLVLAGPALVDRTPVSGPSEAMLDIVFARDGSHSRWTLPDATNASGDWQGATDRHSRDRAILLMSASRSPNSWASRRMSRTPSAMGNRLTSVMPGPSRRPVSSLRLRAQREQEDDSMRT